MTGSGAGVAPADLPHKHDFAPLYVASDPRPLLAELAALDYRIPAYGADLFRRVIDEIGLAGPLLDLCCSFGQDAALLNHDITLDELYAHYADPVAVGLTRGELLTRDRVFYAGHRRRDAVALVGMDASAPAVAYGREAGLFDDAVVADLEADPPIGDSRDISADLSVVRDVGAIGVTGAIGYIGALTFSRLLDAAAGRPWLAGFALRWTDITAVLEVLHERDYRVQVMADHAVAQRRTSGPADSAAMHDGLARLGRLPTALERGGVMSAVPFLATPNGTPAPSLHRLAHQVGASSG